MNEQLSIAEAGPECNPALSQWFTDPALARELVGLAGELLDDAHRRCIPLRVLEPSAGRGNLVRAILARAPGVFVDAIDIDGRWWAELAALGGGVSAIHCDYLTRRPPAHRYDLGVANVPFDNSEEVGHVAKLLDECNRLALLLPARSLHGRERYERLWKRVDRRNPDRDWWCHRKVHCVGRPKFGPAGGSDEIVLLDLRRTPGADVLRWA